MLARVLSTVVLWTILLGSLWLFGAHAAVVLLTLLGALTLHEFYQLTERMGARPFAYLGVVTGIVMLAGPYYLASLRPDAAPDAEALPTALLVGLLLASCLRALGGRDAASRTEAIAATVGGALYIPFLLHYLVRLLMRDGDSNDNLALCVWVVAVSKFCDVGALLTGLAIGRHKMAPVISPKKTWEGAAGGVLVSAGVGAGLAYLLSSRLPDALTPGIAAVVAVPLALTTIVSDLVESVLKRRADAKDTGKLIPGIGGAFDLTDSLLLTAPVAYFILQFFT